MCRNVNCFNINLETNANSTSKPYPLTDSVLYTPPILCLPPPLGSEFRGQMDSLLATLEDMPPVILGEVKGRHLMAASQDRKALEEEHQERVVTMATEKVIILHSNQ